MQQVDYYGLHWDGPVAWLLQGRGTNNFVGLKAQAPFGGARGMCNHLIPAAAPKPDRIHWQRFLEVYDDPLVQAMLPVPRSLGENAFYVEDSYGDLVSQLSTLSRLSSPIKPIVCPIWSMRVKDIQTEMTRTNIQPLVLIQADSKSQEVVDTVVNLSRLLPRTVIVVGSNEPVVQSPMKRIYTRIRDFDLQDLLALPFENIGAEVLRRYARHEQLDAPMETREERRTRQLKERSTKL